MWVRERPRACIQTGRWCSLIKAWSSLGYRSRRGRVLSCLRPARGRSMSNGRNKTRTRSGARNFDEAREREREKEREREREREWRDGDLKKWIDLVFNTTAITLAPFTIAAVTDDTNRNIKKTQGKENDLAPLLSTRNRKTAFRNFPLASVAISSGRLSYVDHCRTRSEHRFFPKWI